MTLLESTPILGVLLAIPVLVFQRVRNTGVSIETLRNPFEWTPARQTDVLAVGTAVIFSLVYIPDLPLHVQFTVRYLVPIIPPLLYVIGRMASIQRVSNHGATLTLSSYAGITLIGGQIAYVWVFTNDLRLGEAVQFHALLNFFAAILLVGWLCVDSFTERWEQSTSVGGALIGIVAGATTVFVLLALWSYFVAGLNFVLPLLNQLSDVITI
jgi:hypothetical protein